MCNNRNTLQDFKLTVDSIPFNKNLIDNLKSIEISYLLAKKVEHGVSFDMYDWKFFEPTKFIYSFFAFNMLYDFDWNHTISNNCLTISANAYASTKIVNLLMFINANTQKNFYDTYLQFDPKLNIINSSTEIKRSGRNDNIYKRDNNPILGNSVRFIDNYLDSLDKLKRNNLLVNHHYRLIIFTYQIRNNIFHGTKNASTMIKAGQRERLLQYSYIILSTVEMFFSIMSELGYYVSDEYDLKENVYGNLQH